MLWYKDTGLSGDFSFPLKYNRTEVLLVSSWALEETFLDDDIHLFLATRRGKLNDGLVVFQEQRFVALRMFFVAIIGDLYYRSVHTSEVTYLYRGHVGVDKDFKMNLSRSGLSYLYRTIREKHKKEGPPPLVDLNLLEEPLYRVGVVECHQPTMRRRSKVSNFPLQE